jgi:NTE family protein
MASPYQINPLNINPLKAVLAEHVDFGRIGQGDGPRIYVSATNVESGRARVFRDRGVTLDAVMASCCVPFIFQAVEIDGAPYWDGGYMGNPVIYPFIRESASADVLLVQINPIRRDGTPRTARDILNRSNEIAFNVSLLKELRLVDFINQAIRRGDLDQSDYREIFLHRVDGGEGLQGLSPSSKLNGEWLFLRHLRDLGRIAAGAWLKANFQFIGARGTLNVEPFYDEP